MLYSSRTDTAIISQCCSLDQTSTRKAKEYQSLLLRWHTRSSPTEGHRLPDQHTQQGHLVADYSMKAGL